MDRRQFLAAGALGVGTFGLGGIFAARLGSSNRALSGYSQCGPAWAVIPVVGDGKWIWTEPPKDQTGYLEARQYELRIGVEVQGNGEATQLRASTPVPTEHPEQHIDEVRLETEGCGARLQAVGEGAGQLLVAAGRISRGQTIRAVAHYKLTLRKQYFAHQRANFPAEQAPPAAIRKLYLQDSPGIQTGSPEVKNLLAELSSQNSSQSSDRQHPWDLAEVFVAWIRKHIKPEVGEFIGVVNALRGLSGDCEEMAGVFVALCRATGIPARLVWVPNHNWAEFYLTDAAGKGHWIPVHTGCYNWFGWTGVHELVIQKGDRITPTHERKAQRLLPDWMQWAGTRPSGRFIAELKPLAAQSGEFGSAGDPGPGGRSKIATGEWKLAGNHPLDRYMRNG